MWCQSCREEYGEVDAGTCKECYEEASETEEELKREIDDLKSKVAFLRLSPPSLDLNPSSSSSSSSSPSAPDLLLLASSHAPSSAPAVPAHRAVLISRSPVFRAMLESEMEESRSGMIRISDVSYDVLRAFVNYLYTAEILLDEQMACDLLVLAEKYQVKYLKAFCEKFMTSKVNNENAIINYAFAHRHNAKQLLDAALSLIMDNMSTLVERNEYKQLVENDPRLVVEIYEAYLKKQVNIALKI
ncbi:BTB/POZ domain-containing protein At4g08455 [Dioscorea cayenensis subsp. rotundata]|uniref:BTB/POZ domain-containing protein At4g08455 n=1 Tax=Dioscorea cayennensis subsp. rotundata TaxID=55577 RepID=A0AB40AZ68_DIOCR|nr:BTB/POZ domain-containing protein At4g08455 [Dioscorea cayenensis subsp. rotundata]